MWTFLYSFVQAICFSVSVGVKTSSSGNKDQNTAVVDLDSQCEQVLNI